MPTRSSGPCQFESCALPAVRGSYCAEHGELIYQPKRGPIHLTNPGGHAGIYKKKKLGRLQLHPNAFMREEDK